MLSASFHFDAGFFFLPLLFILPFIFYYATHAFALDAPFYIDCRAMVTR